MKKIGVTIGVLLVSLMSWGQTNYFPPNGNVGIGITSPQTHLHIRSNVSASATVQSQSSNAYWVADIGGNNGGGLQILNLGVPKSFVYWGNGGAQPSRFGIWVNGSDRLVIRNNGAVGIGTYVPDTSFKLSVNGKIKAKEIKVDTGWADFVFENDYNLPTLQEVEDHIKKKGHLKNIPSAVEVEKNGIFLGEMNAKLLQKIEELTLYLIEQDKQNKEQEERIEKLEQMNSQLLKELRTN